MGHARRQAAVFPYQVRNGRVEVAVITSARNRDWIVPKGRIEDGEWPWVAAAREAEEEAGLLGVVEPVPLGRCDSGNGRVIDVYVLRVTVVLDRWPEDSIRTRRWMSFAHATACLRPEFQPFVTALQHLLDDPTRAGTIVREPTRRSPGHRDEDQSRRGRYRSARVENRYPAEV